MARDRPYLFALNGGEVAKRSLGRIDLKRMALTAEIMSNCLPRVVGPMQFRPGLAYSGSTNGDAKARNIPFIFAADDTALVEVSDVAMRFIIMGTPLTRVAVTTAVTNGDFSSAVGWTTTVTQDGVATIAGGTLTLQTPTRGGSALCKRQVTVAGGDLNKEHGLRIVVTRGPVKFRCGSTDGGDEYIRETALNTGTYSLALTPTGNFFVQFTVESEIQKIVDSITVEAAGVVSLTAPWAAADLNQLRWVQSGDVIFVTNTTQDYQPMRIERRSARSWGITKYEFQDGPWRGKTADVKLNPSGQFGNITLASDAPFFRPEHVGALFKLTHQTTKVTAQRIGGNDEYTDTIKITGLTANNQRDLTYTIITGWVGTITLQVSYDDELTWVKRTSHNASVAGATLQIPGDNIEALVRLGFVGASWTSGVAQITMDYSGGGGDGWVRVTGYTNSTTVSAEVISRLHASGATKNWEEGRHSDVWGWPSAVELFEGRLWFLDQDKLAGTVSDDFSSFDLNEEGDSGPIIRSIASGAVNRGLWMLGLARLVMGTVGAEPVGRSSSFDEPITPDNFSIKDASTQGSADVQAVKVDRSGVFIQRSGKRAYLLSFSIDDQDYSSQDLTRYNSDILAANVVGIAVQRQPDTRLWFWLSDGTAACLVLERSEDVIAWCRFVTDGTIEDISVLPNVEADDVFMVVNRTINGVTKRYREQLAYDTDAEGGTDNHMADSYVVQDLVATANMTNLTHLIGESVVVWIDGAPIMNDPDANGIETPRLFVVDGTGKIVLPQVYTARAIAGLYYEGQWKSSKLAYAAAAGSPISQKKQVLGVQPVLYKTHPKGIFFGQELSPTGTVDEKMVGLPEKYREVVVPADEIIESWDDDQFSIPGGWSPDARACIKMMAPCPATVMALVLKMEAHENG